MDNWWIWTGVAVALALILIVPVRIGFRVRAFGAEVDVFALYHLGGPLRGSVRIPSFKSFKGPQRAVTRRPFASNVWRRRKWALIVLTLRLALAFLRRIDHLDWKTRVGTGDAAYTSWCAGLLWALKSGVVSILSNYVTWLSPPRFHVAPDYEQTYFHADLTCIFRFRVGEIIVAAISYVIGRLRKGGM